jgi:hypothetical protein
MRKFLATITAVTQNNQDHVDVTISIICSDRSGVGFGGGSISAQATVHYDSSAEQINAACVAAIIPAVVSFFSYTPETNEILLLNRYTGF